MPTKRKLSLRKRLLFVTVIALMPIVVLELGTRIFVAIFRPEITLSDLLSRQQDAAGSTVENRRYSLPEVIHPYVGFVVDPTENAQFNEFGFLQIDGPVLKRSAGTVIVGITGGSVARDVCERSWRVLKERVRAALPGVEPKIVCLAQSGFREPQQAMTLSFFQCLGAEFDYVVALDGFNEVALQLAETPKDELWHAYPRNWNVRVADVGNPRLNQLLYQGYATKIQRQELASRFQKLRHVWSVPLHLAWSVMDTRLLARRDELVAALRNEQSNLENRYANRGPAIRFANNEERLEALAELWEACSRQLDRLCRGTQASFIHCLQPNLHIQGPKRTSNTLEGRVSGNSNTYNHSNVVAGYDRFVKTGARLKESGIDFHDLTMIFEETSKPVYSDPYCHFTQYGNDVIAESIAQAIVSRHQRQTEIEKSQAP